MITYESAWQALYNIYRYPKDIEPDIDAIAKILDSEVWVKLPETVVLLSVAGHLFERPNYPVPDDCLPWDLDTAMCTLRRLHNSEALLYQRY